MIAQKQSSTCLRTVVCLCLCELMSLLVCYWIIKIEARRSHDVEVRKCLIEAIINWWFDPPELENNPEHFNFPKIQTKKASLVSIQLSFHIIPCQARHSFHRSELLVMKSTILTIISAIALASATDVNVRLADNTSGSLDQTLKLPSGVCRTFGFFWYQFVR